jgi:hypothetical protein
LRDLLTEHVSSSQMTHAELVANPRSLGSLAYP